MGCNPSTGLAAARERPRRSAMERTLIVAAGLGALSACTMPGGPPPSLAPRAAEAIDPRVPVERPIIVGAVSPGLTGRLAELVAQARSGEAAFAGPAAEAERLAAIAGAPQSESWIAAQEMLSAAIAARGPVTSALSGIDALGSSELAAKGGISPADLEAIATAAAEVGALDRSEAARLDAIRARLGS